MIDTGDFTAWKNNFGDTPGSGGLGGGGVPEPASIDAVCGGRCVRVVDVADCDGLTVADGGEAWRGIAQDIRLTR